MEEKVDFSQYGEHYEESKFWEKLKKYAKTAGIKVVESALQLYFAMQRKETPSWAKTVIIGALGYFIFPLDLIPDTFPLAGYTDDLGMLMAALVTVSSYVTQEDKDAAHSKTEQWFGKNDEKPQRQP